MSQVYLMKICNLTFITTKMKKQFLFALLCMLTFAACTQVDQSLDSTGSRRTLSAKVESIVDYTRAGMESDGAFFWQEGDKIGTLMTNTKVRPMTLVAGDGGKSSGTFEINTSETIGNYAFYPYNEDSNVDANGNLTINFPAEYDYGSVIGEKENSFGIAMWGQILNGSVAFKHLGGVLKIYANDLPVGDNMQFVLSTTGKKLTGKFTTALNCETPVLETSDDDLNDTVVIRFNNTKENATAVFYIPIAVGTYPEIDVVIIDANGKEIAFGYWTDQVVERRAQKKGTISKKEVTGGEIEGVYSPEEGVYEISNLAGLKWVAEQVNQEITTFEGETILLTEDIDLKGEQWTPIGYWTTFNGTFDGQDHTISNLKHHGTEDDCYVGLFGYTEKATIKNLTINNVDLKLVANASWAGGHLGALVGNFEGTTVIENINITGDVKIDGDIEKNGAGRIGAVAGGGRIECNATFKNVHVKANEGSFVKGNNSIGGIAGQLQGNITIENCSTNIDVTAGKFFAGGIVGLTSHYTTFTNCHTSGNIAVVAGRAGNKVDLYRVGGIAGGWDDSATQALVLEECSYTGEISGQSVDGTIANNFACDGYVGIGYSEVIGAVVMVNGVEYKYSGNGNYISGGYEYDAEAKVAKIYDAEGVQKLAELVNGGHSFAGETILLAGDIDLAAQTREVSNWTSIGTSEKPFSGTFDGQGYTIKNLNIVEAEAKESKAYMGFFGYAKNATIKNVVFENVYINIPCLDIDHSQGHIGAVAGSLEGTSTIENVTVKGDIKIYTTQEANGASRVAVVAGGNAYGNVTMKNVHVVANKGSYLIANNNTGALAGQLQGECYFVDCSSNIDVTVNKFFAGGIIGLTATKSSFTNCHTTGDVKVVAGRAGRANDHYRVGGIVGGWSDGKSNVCTLTNCSYTGEVSGVNADGSVAKVLDYDGYVGRGYTLTNCAGSKVVIDDKTFEQVADKIYGFYVVDGVYELNSAAAMKWFAEQVSGTNSFAGKSVVMIDDIDLGGEEWKPIGMGGKHFEGIFDGQGHTIKGLKVTARNSASQAALFCSAAGSAEFKNFVIDEAYVKYPADSNDYYAAAVVGTVYGSLKFEGINVKNSTITGNNKVGAIFAHDGSATQITINNCHVDKCYIASEDTADGGCVGGLVGYFATGVAGKPNTISNSSVKNSTIVGINSSNSGKRANSEFIGCIQTKDAMELNIVDCVVAGNSFSQTIDGTAAVTYVGAFPVQFIGGDRAEKLLGNITINGVRAMKSVAEVNGVDYSTLQEAIAAVAEGGTVKLTDNVIFTEATRTHNTGTWYDGLYYVGDKSFTLDLNGKTISHDGSVNDYLLNFKNAGSKANTITIKNGTVDAGTAAFCALCTSSVQENQLTINLEGVTLYNNISNGSTAKIRGGAILNVKSGAKIIGKDSYLAIECANSTVNIYEGAELYMNGTTSYNGCLAGVGGGGTINVYGGYGKGVKGGFIAMTSGGTINISGGEWIANTNGTVGSDSNWHVLTAQSNQSESGFVGGSYINVTGGTFRGGMDAWILGQGPDEEAGLNISGGNFNVDPTKFINTEYYKVTTSNGSYTVVARKYIYLKASHWEVDGARFEAYLWGGTPDIAWISLTSIGDNIFRGELPDGYNYGCNIIFCRMNPAGATGNWNSKWNQTANLTVPTDGNNLFTVKNNAWDNATGTWSKYTAN